MRHSKLILFFAGLIAIYLFSRCSQSSTKTSLLPTITGKPGELIIIVDNPVWNTEVGDTLTKLVNEIYPSLPQEEPVFTATHIPHSAFNTIFKTHRNLFFVNINPHLSNDSAQLLIKKDRWANGQLIIECQARDAKTAAKIIGKNKSKITTLINSEERRRIQGAYKHNNNRKLTAFINKKFHIHITIPISYNLNIDTTDFVWISRETVEISQGLFIYRYPYEDTADFSLNHIIARRNDFLKRFIKGAVPNSWMTTETRLGLHIKKYRHNKQYFSEVRGLWRVENDFMGGPFISLTTTSPDGKYLITIEGYVFAPKHDKREYLRQMESIVYSMF